MIKNFKQFISEAISGTELFGKMGPNYGEQILRPTISRGDTQVIYTELTDEYYTFDEFNDLKGEYLKNGGKPLEGYNKENLEKMITYLKTK